MQLEYLKQKREARLLILERLVRARNELIGLKMPHNDLDQSIKLMRKKIILINDKILKIMVDIKKESL